MTTLQRVYKSILSLIWLACLTFVLGSTPAYADGPNRVGLILMHGNGQVVKRCVTFNESQITGLELLQRAALDLSVDASNPMGATICRIEQEGCTFPSQSCFCQCQGSPCVYWSYWHLIGGNTWQYSSMGTANRTVVNGDVDGWIWGAGTMSSAVPPPSVTFDEICPPPTAIPSPTATNVPPTNTPIPPRPTDTPFPPTDTPEPPRPTNTPSLPIVGLDTATPEVTATATEPAIEIVDSAPTATVEAIPTAADPSVEARATTKPSTTPSPALVAQASTSPVTSRPTRSASTSPLLAREVTSTPPAMPANKARSSVPMGLLAAGIVLAGVGAGGLGILVARRRSHIDR